MYRVCYLKARRYLPEVVPKDKANTWLARTVSWTAPTHDSPYMQPADICHVELVIPMDCTHRVDCPYCLGRTNERPARRRLPLRRRHHYLSFTVDDVAPRNFVRFSIDRRYRSQAWLSAKIWVTVAEWVDISTFLFSQLGKGFNRQGMYTNFALAYYYQQPWYGVGLPRCAASPAPFVVTPTPTLAWYQYGCPRLYPESYAVARSLRQGWFCSELVTAALFCVGLCADCAPATVSPNQLWWAARFHPRFVCN